jgi:hypothetical protein
MLRTLDLMKDDVAVLHPAFGIYWQYVVCYITGTKYKVALRREIFFKIRRQTHIPLLAYFRRRVARPVVVFIFVWSLGCLVFLVSSPSISDLGSIRR